MVELGKGLVGEVLMALSQMGREVGLLVAVYGNPSHSVLGQALHSSLGEGGLGPARCSQT